MRLRSFEMQPESSGDRLLLRPLRVSRRAVGFVDQIANFITRSRYRGHFNVAIQMSPWVDGRANQRRRPSCDMVISETLSGPTDRISTDFPDTVSTTSSFPGADDTRSLRLSGSHTKSSIPCSVVATR